MIKLALELMLDCWCYVHETLPLAVTRALHVTVELRSICLSASFTVVIHCSPPLSLLIIAFLLQSALCQVRLSNGYSTAFDTTFTINYLLWILMVEC